ncbi:MAG: choice-of-anchor tandem repeat GloVer-containing protein, partial [Vicingaceae bacterium]
MNVSTKLFFISFLLNIVSLSTYSQTTELLGNLEVYANDNLGSIIHIDSASKKIKIGKDYHRNNWSSFTLVKANDGYYYGIRTTPNREAVVIYRVDATKGESQEIHQFSFPGNSMDVTSSLIEAAPGELWGQLANCGINNKGVIYSYNYITDSAKVEFHLDSINSDYPIGGLTKASNGKIYGVSRDIRSGTNAKVGSIYEIDLTSHTITNRFTFSSSAMKGVYPGTQLVEAANGMLYGICSLGGSINGSGTLFEYNPNTHTVWKRKQFINTSTIGDLPIPRLFPAANGKFYGATSNGGVYGHGSIFEFDTITNQVTDIYDKDSSMAVAHITHEDSNGRLIGYSADNNSYSSIFSFDRAQSQISSLFDFNRDDYSLFIYKDSVNRYIAGGKIVVSFDSLFNNYEVITKGGQCMDGGRIRDPLTKASNGWFYGHSKSSTYEPVLIRYNPVNYKFDVVKIFLPKDSMYNITGPFVEHPNGNLYAPISSEWNAFREMPYPQILELNPANDSLSVVYQFPYKFLDIRSLKVDANGNFYGIANGGMVNSSGNQQSGKYFFTVNNQLDSTRTIYRIFNSNFSQTDIAVKDSLVLGLYNSTSPKLFKYNINLDTIVFRSLNGNNVRSHLIQGNGGLYYGLMDEKIVSINVNNFQQNTVIDFANNPSIAGREPMTLSYGNGRLYGYNKRSPSSYNKNSIFSIDPLIGISSLELIQEIDSTEGAVLGGYNYGQIGANPQLIKVCRPSSKPELSLNDDTICPGGSVKLIAGLDNLNSGYAWELYEGNKTNLISTDTSGVFNISPDSTTWYYLKGVGSCFTQAPYDSVRIVELNLKVAFKP